MCRVSTFCFCCSLQVGTIAAAIATTFFLAITAAQGALFLSKAWVSFDKENVDELTLWLMQSSIYLTLSVLILIADGFLLLGLLKNRSSYLIPWLILSIAIMILLIVHEGWSLNETGTALSLEMFIFFLFKLILLMFGIYLWITGYSYYRELSYKGL